MDQIRKLIIQNYIESYNRFDVEGMVVDLHEQVVFENIFNNEVTLSIKGIDNFLKQAEEARSLFKQREMTPTHWTFDQQMTIVDMDYRATIAKTLRGLKEGDRLGISCQSIFHFRENEITRIIDKS